MLAAYSDATRRRRVWYGSAVLLFVQILAVRSPVGADVVTQGRTTRVSVDSDGRQADQGVIRTHFARLDSLSGDGRLVVFVSEATNLVDDDHNERMDVFIHDRVTERTERIVAPACVGIDPFFGGCGRDLDAGASQSAISRNGRYIAFGSTSSNVLTSILGTRTKGRVYVYDRALDLTALASVSPSGDPFKNPAISPAISGDGRYIAFEMLDGLGYREGLFLRDMVAGRTERVDRWPDGRIGYGAGASISDDGRFVTFYGMNPDECCFGIGGIYVRDRLSGAIELVSVAPDGTPANSYVDMPVISGSGRYVAFSTVAKNLASAPLDPRPYIIASIVVRDRLLGTNEIVSLDNFGQRMGMNFPDAAISYDGRYVAFAASADVDSGIPGIVEHSYGVFVRDRALGVTYLVSADNRGLQANEGYDGDEDRSARSDHPAISDDGQVIAFLSTVSNLVDGDTNNAADFFVRDRRGPCQLNPACVPWPS